MELVETGWKMLKAMPPMASWKILHNIPYPLLDVLATINFNMRPRAPLLETEFLGYRLSNPIGIAAGLDKDGSLVRILQLTGAGFHVVGSVLPHRFEGVEPKLLLRLPSGTLNRLGLPSPGPLPVIKRLIRANRYVRTPVVVSIASLTLKGFGDVYRLVKHIASWVELNISCPNIESHGSFEDPEYVTSICNYMKPLDKPVLLKIPRTVESRMIKRYIDAALDCGFKGIVAANTLKVKLGSYNAGYGGSWLFKSTIHMVRLIHRYAPDEFKIVASGGIDSGLKAYKVLKEGADLVEVLSVLVNRGPRALVDIIGELYKITSKRGPPRREYSLHHIGSRGLIHKTQLI
ncbi:MAG: hypothetical protein GSR85_07480 [Desulfurococcales archaeon]|nr:hypothetical protein [Desulfurococcales archaeon]